MPAEAIEWDAGSWSRWRQQQDGGGVGSLSSQLPKIVDAVGDKTWLLSSTLALDVEQILQKHLALGAKHASHWPGRSWAYARRRVGGARLEEMLLGIWI